MRSKPILARVQESLRLLSISEVSTTKTSAVSNFSATPSSAPHSSRRAGRRGGQNFPLGGGFSGTIFREGEADIPNYRRHAL